MIFLGKVSRRVIAQALEEMPVFDNLTDKAAAIAILAAIGEADCEDMSDELREWMHANGIPEGSGDAEDMQTDERTPEQLSYLREFCDRWEIAEKRRQRHSIT